MSFEEFQKEVEHLGETKGACDHDHDMIHELSRKLDALWRYDQYITNAKDFENIQKYWIKIKKQEEEDIKELKSLIVDHIKTACF